jgi:phosphoribosylformimino-5-aminoimidazole carboxamide ribotide isomerase
MNIYPAIDIKDGACVRLTQGHANAVTTYHADPLQPAHEYAAAGAGWLHLVDLDGAFAGTPRNLDTLRRIAKAHPGLRIQYGGGLREASAVQAALEAGATRVILGTRAATDETFVAQTVRAHGKAIAIGIDAKDGMIAVKGWVETTSHEATAFASRMGALGVQTLIYTDIATDGMLSGPNFLALGQMLQATTANIIASGGVASLDDIRNLKALSARHANLDGAIIGKALYEKRLQLPDLLQLANPPSPPAS